MCIKHDTKFTPNKVTDWHYLVSLSWSWADMIMNYNNIQCAKNPCPNESFTWLNVPLVATASGACPGGWYHFATSCYAFIDAEPLGWTEAMVCFVCLFTVYRTTGMDWRHGLFCLFVYCLQNHWDGRRPWFVWVFFSVHHPVREHFIHKVTSLLPVKASKIRVYAQRLRFLSRGSLSCYGASVYTVSFDESPTSWAPLTISQGYWGPIPTRIHMHGI